MSNEVGLVSSKMKYGYEGFGSRLLVGPVPVGASEAFKNSGGKFVWFDTSRRIEVAGSGNNPDSGAFILGWAECGEFTASSTEGKTKLMVDVSTNSVYRIPADAAVTAAMRGKSCDLVTASDIQKADVGEANEKYLLIRDIDIANQEVLVSINPAAHYRTAIA